MAFMTKGGNGKAIVKDICDVFGLKHVRDLKIHFPTNGIFTLTVEFYPEIDGVMQMMPTLKKFKLVPIDEPGKENNGKET